MAGGSFFGWSSVFWVNLPIGAAGLALAAVAVAESPDRRSRRLDVPGVVTSALGLTGVTGAMFYLTLLHQDVHGWSVLRTGLSWLLMNIPCLIIARQAGRMHGRLSGAAIVGFGCLTAGTTIVVLSVLDASTPFVVAAVGCILWGLGFGSSAPGISHVATRDVPSAVSGAASGVLNASRQVGTSVGLAVLGAIGTGATVSDWTAKAAGFPAPARAAASGQAQDVAGARIAAVTGALGPRYRDAAVQSFVHGYHLAVGAAAACLLAAAVIAFIGLRTGPRSRQPATPAAGPPQRS